MVIYSGKEINSQSLVKGSPPPDQHRLNLQQPQSKNFCSKCGYQYKAEGNFCKSCGAPINKN